MYGYVGNEVWNAVDVDGLMRIYMFPNPGAGNGNLPTYEFRFDPIKNTVLDKLLGRVNKIGNRVGQVGEGAVWASSPTPYKSKKNHGIDCGVFEVFRLAFHKK